MSFFRTTQYSSYHVVDVRVSARRRNGAIVPHDEPLDAPPAEITYDVEVIGSRYTGTMQEMPCYNGPKDVDIRAAAVDDWGKVAVGEDRIGRLYLFTERELTATCDEGQPGGAQ